MTGKLIQHGEVPRLVQQSALIRLTFDLHQQVADAPEQGDARRCVVDEGTAAPIGTDNAAQQELATMVEIVLGQQSPNRIGLPDVEGSSDAGAVAAARHDA